MHKKLTTSVPPETIWRAWEEAHRLSSSAPLTAGKEKYLAANGKFRYQIVEVVPHKKFSLLWKTLFIHLLFTHEVERTPFGSEISYRVQVKGLFAPFVRWALKSKLEASLDSILRSFVDQLEKAR